MRPLILSTAVALGALIVFGLYTQDTQAQSNQNIDSGIVTSIQTDQQGNLTAFSIIDPDGETIRYEVNDQTEYGLENQAGDRWVSDQAADPKEAATRLRDQQRRQTRITVSSDNQRNAITVVQAESSNLDSNLGYLFAALAITWIGFIAYIVYMARRQRILASEIVRLRQSIQTE